MAIIMRPVIVAGIEQWSAYVVHVGLRTVLEVVTRWSEDGARRDATTWLTRNGGAT